MHPAGPFAVRISIHSHHLGRDTASSSPVAIRAQFQPTLPVWRGVKKTTEFSLVSLFQLTLHVRGETLSRSKYPRRNKISTRSTRAGRDDQTICLAVSPSLFQPTFHASCGLLCPGVISIRTPCASKVTLTGASIPSRGVALSGRELAAKLTEGVCEVRALCCVPARVLPHRLRRSPLPEGHKRGDDP